MVGKLAIALLTGITAVLYSLGSSTRLVQVTRQPNFHLFTFTVKMQADYSVLNVKVMVGRLAIVLLTGIRLMTSSALQSWKYEGRSINKFQTAPFHQFLK